MMTSEDIKRIKEGREPLDLTKQIDDLKKKVKEAGRINQLHQELVEKLKAELSRAKEDHQYDNLVHAEELRKVLKE
tara:strand:- start:68 stop:295 length:228 start_codon:yes stop_codon:yes gene_type:complete